MRLSKPGIMISIIAVGAFAGFLAIQAFDSHETTTNPKNPLAAASQAPVSPDVPGRPAVPQKLPPDIEKLNATQKEIAGMTLEQLEKETLVLKAKLNENNLLTRMKEKKVEGEEKEQAKQMLIRLSLIGVEKARRDMPLKKPGSSQNPPAVQANVVPVNPAQPTAQAGEGHEGHNHGDE